MNLWQVLALSIGTGSATILPVSLFYNGRCRKLDTEIRLHSDENALLRAELLGWRRCRLVIARAGAPLATIDRSLSDIRDLHVRTGGALGLKITVARPEAPRLPPISLLPPAELHSVSLIDLPVKLFYGYLTPDESAVDEALSTGLYPPTS